MIAVKALGGALPKLGKSMGFAVSVAEPPPLAEMNLQPRPGSERERLEQAAVAGVGTLPERIVEKWLIKKQIPYQGQAAANGGFLRVGGANLDFVLPIGKPPGMALRVQGDYWHSMEPRKSKDAIQYTKLVGMGYDVKDLWELEIYDAVLNGYLDSYLGGIVYS